MKSNAKPSPLFQTTLKLYEPFLEQKDAFKFATQTQQAFNVLHTHPVDMKNVNQIASDFNFLLVATHQRILSKAAPTEQEALSNQLNQITDQIIDFFDRGMINTVRDMPEAHLQDCFKAEKSLEDQIKKTLQPYLDMIKTQIDCAAYFWINYYVAMDMTFTAYQRSLSRYEALLTVCKDMVGTLTDRAFTAWSADKPTWEVRKYNKYTEKRETLRQYMNALHPCNLPALLDQLAKPKIEKPIPKPTGPTAIIRKSIFQPTTENPLADNKSQSTEPLRKLTQGNG